MASSSPSSAPRGRLAAFALAFAALATAGTSACVVTEIDCDVVVRRCRTRCDYWCDGWGCWPSCWDQCWDECHDLPEPDPAPTPSPSPAADASAAGGDDAGSAPAVLCKPCASNDACAGGGLCIVRGGASAGGSADGGAANGVCGVPCAGEGTCPSGFTCEALGTTRQCVPEANACR